MSTRGEHASSVTMEAPARRLTRRPTRRRRAPAVLSVLALTLTVAGPALVTGVPRASGLVRAAASARHASPADTEPVNTWPKAAYNAANADVSPDPDISTANASQLGVRWMSGTGTTEYGSAVVQWNAQLGETLVYQGNENGYLTAFDEANGDVVWSTFLGSAIRDTPLVEGNNVWVADTFSPELYKLNAATGAEECATPMVSTNNGSATIGAGPGGALTIFIAVNDLGTANGPVYAVSEADCSVEWTYSAFNGNDQAGSWDFLSYADDADGVPLLLVGTADPDSSVYGIDAATGTKVWSFQTLPVSTTTDTDVGAGVSVTAPGVNGFADGVAYVPGKDGYVYALDLTTGALLWDYDFGAAFSAGPPYSRSTPAVVGDNVIVGGTMGVIELNATTGALEWHWQGTAGPGGGGANEVVGAISVVGPPGQQVAAITNLAGYFDVLDVQTGALLYSYKVGSFSVASVADVDGNLLVGSSDGFLYDFAVGGANGPGPSTTVTAPAAGTTLGYPRTGDVTITGTATGGPFSSVDVAVEEGGSSGPWWNADADAYATGYDNNLATMATPGQATTTWSLTIPVPTAGDTYRVLASANATDGLADTTDDAATPSPSQDSFDVTYLHTVPHLVATDGSFVAPGATIKVAGSGFGDGEQVALSLAGSTVATVAANASGAFSATAVPIPSSAATGVVPLVGTGATTGHSTSVPIDVSNEWWGQGGGPLHDAADAHDAVLSDHVSPSGGAYLTQAWSYPSGAAIETSPTVVKNVAYFANDAGTVTALDVRNSVPLWTYQAGGPIDSSPMVDGNAVVFGTEGGTVVALSTTTGSLLWQTTVDAAVSSSPEADGASLYVGTADGSLYDLSLSTGAVNWQDALGGQVLGSPAVDGAKSLVVVGAGDALVAVKAATGAQVWSQTTGGAVTAYPTIDGTQVYVGSGDGVVHQFAVATGAPVWSYATGSSITVGGAIDGTGTTAFYVVGTTAGTVYYFRVQTGELNRTYAIGSAVGGISTAPGFAVVTSAGGVVAGYKYEGYPSWSYKATSGFDTAPAVVNGIVYLTGLDQTIRAFTIPGRPVP